MLAIGCQSIHSQGAGSKLIYILSHSSHEAGLASFTSFRADPEWIKAKSESEKDGSLTLPQPDGCQKRLHESY